MPIWALAGLGEEARSLVGAADRAAESYTPSTLVERPTITSTQPPPGCVRGPNGLVCGPGGAPVSQREAVAEESGPGTPWFLWAVVGVGVLGMVASAYGDKDFEQNGRRRGGRRRGDRSVIIAVSSKRASKTSKRLASERVRKVQRMFMDIPGARRGFSAIRKMGNQYEWTVEATMSERHARFARRELKRMGIPAVVVEK